MGWARNADHTKSLEVPSRPDYVPTTPVDRRLILTVVPQCDVHRCTSMNRPHDLVIGYVCI